MSDEDRAAMIRSMVQRLAARLADNPDDLAGWRRLARAYAVLGEADKERAVRERIAARQRETFAAGAKAFDGGDYATAFENWHRLAAAGDAGTFGHAREAREHGPPRHRPDGAAVPG